MIGKMKFANAALVAAVFFAANGGLLYEPQNYVAQDNLVVNLDGIRNAGLLKATTARRRSGRTSGALRTTPRSPPRRATRASG